MPGTGEATRSTAGAIAHPVNMLDKALLPTDLSVRRGRRTALNSMKLTVMKERYIYIYILDKIVAAVRARETGRDGDRPPPPGPRNSISWEGPRGRYPVF